MKLSKTILPVFLAVVLTLCAAFSAVSAADGYGSSGSAGSAYPIGGNTGSVSTFYI